MYLYAIDTKGTSMSVLRLQTGKVHTINLPAKIAGDASDIDMSRVTSYFMSDKVIERVNTDNDYDDGEGREDLAHMSRASIVMLRCTLAGRCSADTVFLASPAQPDLTIPVLSDTSLTCGSGNDNDSTGHSILGAGRMPHSKHEGQGADSVFCATATFDEETREHGVAMSFLGNKKEEGIRYEGVLSSNKKHGFRGWTFASCSVVPNRGGSRVTKVEATFAAAKGNKPSGGGKMIPSPLLCVAVTTTGTTIALKRELAISVSTTSLSRDGKVSPVWVREEALSRVEKPPCTLVPSVMRRCSMLEIRLVALKKK